MFEEFARLFNTAKMDTVAIGVSNVLLGISACGRTSQDKIIRLMQIPGSKSQIYDPIDTYEWWPGTSASVELTEM